LGPRQCWRTWLVRSQERLDGRGEGVVGQECFDDRSTSASITEGIPQAPQHGRVVDGGDPKEREGGSKGKCIIQLLRMRPFWKRTIRLTEMG